MKTSLIHSCENPKRWTGAPIERARSMARMPRIAVGSSEQPLSPSSGWPATAWPGTNASKAILNPFLKNRREYAPLSRTPTLRSKEMRPLVKLMFARTSSWS
eukprot:Amastigsp_a343836_39.p4 type:complete len:102 gc:universal Amastigsp_a343836_39:1020-715(-)